MCPLPFISPRVYFDDKYYHNGNNNHLRRTSKSDVIVILIARGAQSPLAAISVSQRSLKSELGGHSYECVKIQVNFNRYKDPFDQSWISKCLSTCSCGS